MARRLAAFQVLRDCGFKLKKCDDPRQFKMKMSRIDGAHALLAYKVWTNGKPVKYEVDIYDCAGNKKTLVHGATASNRMPTGTWEAFPAGAAARGNVRFRVKAGSGTAYFADVVLWCMRN